MLLFLLCLISYLKFLINFSFYQIKEQMKNSESNKQEGKANQPYSHLKIIFAYYCKLNNQKVKHKMFEDFNEKTEVMSLHEFMTFCKNFQFTAKQHKRIENNILSRFLDSKREKPKNQEDGSIIKKVLQVVQKKINKQLSSKQQILEKENTKDCAKAQENQFANASENHVNIEIPSQTPIIIPLCFLNEKKIAQIFKKNSNPQGQINFQSFIVILKQISQQMYQQAPLITNSKQQQTKQSDTKDQKQEPINKKGPDHNDSFMNFLGFISLDTKFHIIEIFAKINQFHGTMEHLALMRSPIKKLNLKNDPLGKYAKKDEDNKQNNSNSRFRNFDKSAKSPQRQEKLPVIRTNATKQVYSHAKNDGKPISKQQLSGFLLANKSQIQHLNKSYFQSSLMSQNPTKRQSSTLEVFEGNISKNHSYCNQKSGKKYSQRHKDKVIGDIHHKEIGKLIDVSSLYDDQIFNKYVELNYKPRQ